MKLRSSALAALAALLLLAYPVAAQEVPKGRAPGFERRLVDLSEHIRQRTVLIYGLIGLGSGAVVTPDGVVVTNAHVMAGARYGILEWADGTQTLARRRGIDYGRDLAILEPVDPLPGPRPAFGFGGSLREGTWVLAAGFPGGLRTTPEPTISLGQIKGKGGGSAAPLGALDYSAAYRSDAPIFSGNSGGPLVDLDGRLVGINGAVDLESATTLTIPVEVVAERLGTLQGGVVMLPGGQTLDPRTNKLLDGYYKLVDSMLRQMPQRVADGSRQAADARERIEERLEDALPKRQASDRLAGVGRMQPRENALLGLYAGPNDFALTTDDGVLLTPIDGRFAVTKASALKGPSPRVDGKPAEVVARSEDDDLALLRLPITGPKLEDAPLRRVGSLVYLGGVTSGVPTAPPFAAGIVSADPRPTSATVLAHIQQGGIPAPLAKALDLLERLPGLKDLADQIRRSLEARNAFAAGTSPRSYAHVLSIDAPVPGSCMGAPCVDREGRLIGVTVGIGHYGTTYVVPMVQIRQVFAAQLGGALRPERVGAAKLY